MLNFQSCRNKAFVYYCV